MRLAEVDQRQHHEDECLQQHDENVEDRPDRAGDNMTDEAERGGGTAEQGNKEENQLASVHVAEQPHAEGDGLGDELDQVEREVRNPEDGIRPKRRTEQFVDESAYSLDLEVVVDHQDQYTDGNAEGAIQVRGWQRAGVLESQAVGNRRDPIDGKQVDRVHQNDPAKHRERHWGNEAAIAVDDALRLAINHLDEEFDRCLKATRHTRSGFLRDASQKKNGNEAGQDGEEECVEMEVREIEQSMLFARRQMMEVMDDIL